MQLVLAHWTGWSNGLDLGKTYRAVNSIEENLNRASDDGLQVVSHDSPLLLDQ